MSPRVRVLALVALAAAVAAALAVGVTVLASNGSEEPSLPEGAPPLVLELGVRTDAEAVSLRRAARLYAQGRAREAGRIFAGRPSLQAQVGAALAAWPAGSLQRLEQLARGNPSSGVVQLHLGLARFWSGDRNGALAAWRAARGRDPDSPAAVRASDLLYPDFPRGLPLFVPSFGPNPRLARLPPPRQLAVLRQAARRPEVRAKLLYGLALQRLERPLSARRQYAIAARLAPRDPEARVADAVGRFDKAHPERAFARLGPLVRTFPRAATVRFHLGVLLLWLGRVEQAARELELSRVQGRGSSLEREAKRLLERLEAVRSR